MGESFMLDVNKDFDRCPHCGGSGEVLNSVAIGNKIRDLRKEMGITMWLLAKKLGLSVSYLSDLELGRRVWTMGKFHRHLEAMAELIPPPNGPPLKEE